MNLIFTIEKLMNLNHDTAESVYQRMIESMKKSDRFRIVSCKHQSVKFEYRESPPGTFFVDRSQIYYIDSAVIKVVIGEQYDLLRITYPVSYVEISVFITIILMITIFASAWAIIGTIPFLLTFWHEIVKTRKKCEAILEEFIGS